MVADGPVVIKTATDAAYQVFRRLLEHYVNDPGWCFDSIEVQGGTTNHDRGMKLFVNGKCIVHVMDAICAHDDPAISFSERLLELLGIAIDKSLRYDLACARWVRFDRHPTMETWTRTVSIEAEPNSP